MLQPRKPLAPSFVPCNVRPSNNLIIQNHTSNIWANHEQPCCLTFTFRTLFLWLGYWVFDAKDKDNVFQPKVSICSVVAASGEETGVSSIYLPSSTPLLASTLKSLLREDNNFSLSLLCTREASVKIPSFKIANTEKNKRTNLWWDLMVTTSHILLLVSVLAPLRQRQTGHKTSSNYAASALWLAVSTLEIMVVLPLLVTKNGTEMVIR